MIGVAKTKWPFTYDFADGTLNDGKCTLDAIDTF